MQSLPPELLYEVVKHLVDYRDLRAVCSSCRLLRPPAEYFIWRSVRSRDRDQTKRACEVLISCPRFQPIVHSLAIANELGPYPSPDIQTWRTFANALRCLTNLKILKIEDGYGETNGWIFNGCTFSLNELICPFLIDPTLLAFLHKQNSMTIFLGNALSPNLNSMALCRDKLLPNLQVLRLDLLDAALEFVSNRPISHLWVLTPTYDIDDHFLSRYLPALSRSTAQLRSFRIGFPYNKAKTLALLSALASYAPNLRSLGFLQQFTADDADFIEAIAQFKHLHSLVAWNVVSAYAIKAVAQACKSLRLVACLHYSYSHEYLFFPVNQTGALPRAVHDPDLLLWKDA